MSYVTQYGSRRRPQRCRCRSAAVDEVIGRLAAVQRRATRVQGVAEAEERRRPRPLHVWIRQQRLNAVAVA